MADGKELESRPASGGTDIFAIHRGDCLEVMRDIPDGSVNLIVTSPPYADARKHTYGGIAPDDYVDWFLPRSEQMLRVLAPDGSFCLNIKEKCVDGELHDYVIDLIKALRAQGWRRTEEYIWHKTTAMPGYWPTRLRDAWERILHFTKNPQFKMRQDQVKVPVAHATARRYQTLVEKDFTRQPSATGSGFGLRREQFADTEMVLPTNVLHFSPVASNTGHSAPFPAKLPEFFINLFTDPGDVVLDPFLGGGATYRAARGLMRRPIGIEMHQEYVDAARRSVAQGTLALYG